MKKKKKSSIGTKKGEDIKKVSQKRSTKRDDSLLEKRSKSWDLQSVRRYTKQAGRKDHKRFTGKYEEMGRERIRGVSSSGKTPKEL